MHKREGWFHVWKGGTMRERRHTVRPRPPRSVATARFRNTQKLLACLDRGATIWHMGHFLPASIHRHYSVPRGARVCSTPISVTLARRTRIRLSFRGKLNGYRICGIRAFRPGGCFLQRSFRMENSVQGNHKHPPFPSSNAKFDDPSSTLPKNNVGLKSRSESWGRGLSSSNKIVFFIHVCNIYNRVTIFD